MAKFEVTIYIEGYYTIEVEAETEDDAQEIAKKKFTVSELDDVEFTEIEVTNLDKYAKEDK